MDWDTWTVSVNSRTRVILSLRGPAVAGQPRSVYADSGPRADIDKAKREAVLRRI